VHGEEAVAVHHEQGVRVAGLERVEHGHGEPVAGGQVVERQHDRPAVLARPGHGVEVLAAVFGDVKDADVAGGFGR
jgi:hypothetical protein